MRSKFILLLLPFVMISCKEGELSGGVSKASPGEKVEEVKVEPEITVPLAETPVVINGASLTCIANVTQGIDCEIKKDRNLTDIAFATAYIIKSPDLLWVETTYQVTGVGKIHVDTPLNTSLSYGVGVRTSAKEVLATWVVPPSESGLDLVTNGSFENYTQGGVGSFFPEIFRDGDWQASLRNTNPAQNECLKPYLEIQASDPAQASASDGNYMMDTNSGCVINNTIASNPVIVWQEMKSKNGHLYEFTIDARKNPYSTRNVLGINYAGKGVKALELKGNGIGQWEADLKFLVAADRDGGKIEFLDLEPNPDGRGALIDNVRFYDLGMPPQ